MIIDPVTSRSSVRVWHPRVAFLAEDSCSVCELCQFSQVHFFVTRPIRREVSTPVILNYHTVDRAGGGKKDYKGQLVQHSQYLKYKSSPDPVTLAWIVSIF